MAPLRDPCSDPQAGDEVYLSFAGGRVRVLEVGPAGVAWMLLAGARAGRRQTLSLARWRLSARRVDVQTLNQRPAQEAALGSIDQLPVRQRPAASAYLAACERLAGPDRRVRASERERLAAAGLTRSSGQRAEAALVELRLLEVESTGEHAGAVRVLRLAGPARETRPRDVPDPPTEAPRGRVDPPAGPSEKQQSAENTEEEQQHRPAHEKPSDPPAGNVTRPRGTELEEQELRARIVLLESMTALVADARAALRERVGPLSALLGISAEGRAPGELSQAPGAREKLSPSPQPGQESRARALNIGAPISLRDPRAGDGALVDALMEWLARPDHAADLRPVAMLLARAPIAEGKQRAVLRRVWERVAAGSCENPTGLARTLARDLGEDEERAALSAHEGERVARAASRASAEATRRVVDAAAGPVDVKAEVVRLRAAALAADGQRRAGLGRLVAAAQGQDEAQASSEEPLRPVEQVRQLVGAHAPGAARAAPSAGPADPSRGRAGSAQRAQGLPTPDPPPATASS